MLLSEVWWEQQDRAAAAQRGADLYGPAGAGREEREGMDWALQGAGRGGGRLGEALTQGWRTSSPLPLLLLLSSSE